MSLEERKHSKVLPVLTQGRKILWNAQPSGRLAARVLLPLRDVLLDPLFGLGILVLPTLGQAFPRIDTLLTALVRGNVWFLEWFYYNDNDNNNRTNDWGWVTTASSSSSRALERRRTVKFARPPSSDWISAARGTLAMALSVTAELVAVVVDRSQRTTTTQQWWKALAEFQSFLNASGVAGELQEAIAKPFWEGRLLDNVKILNDVQQVLYRDRASRIATLPDTKQALLEGKRMMRFATAAYGMEMIRSALDRDADAAELGTPLDAIAFHCHVPSDDIRILVDVDDGGDDMSVLRHFVAIDRATHSVVLALRGTLSISGALVDMKGMDHDYCCCKAHKGMAEMADNVWKHSGQKILELLEQEVELHDYAVIMVGHSLGAGVASLLNVKCHVEQIFGNRPVKCYGFAPPPTLAIDSLSSDSIAMTLIRKAFDNCICYMHDNDCIPFLSVVCIRRLAALMDAVDNRTENMWAFRRWKIFWEYEKVPQQIFDDIQAVEERIREVDFGKGASRLIIPTKLVVWMKRNLAGTYEAFGCDPNHIADLNIFCNQDMVSDHLCEPYEDAFDILSGGL